METYFFIIVLNSGRIIRQYGPYISYLEAAEVMLNHLRSILWIEIGPIQIHARAQLVERHLTEDGWKDIALKAEEELKIGHKYVSI